MNIALTIDCPVCHRKIGEVCCNGKGIRLPSTRHKTRLSLARKIQKEGQNGVK